MDVCITSRTSAMSTDSRPNGRGTNGYHSAASGGHDTNLSPEARCFRRLLCYHIGKTLQEREIQLPRSLASEVQMLPTSPGRNGSYNKVDMVTSKTANNAVSNGLSVVGSNDNEISYDELKVIFSRLVMRFEHQYRSQIEGFVSKMQITPLSIEVSVIGVIREIFADEQVSWGRLVALTAFITNIALECSRAELAHTIEPLIDHTARISEEQIVPFIRQNGGWAGFAHFFNVDKEDDEQRTEDSDSSFTLSKLATYAVGAIGVGVLTAFWARK